MRDNAIATLKRWQEQAGLEGCRGREQERVRAFDRPRDCVGTAIPCREADGGRRHSGGRLLLIRVRP